MVKTLERIAADPKTRRAMQEEEFAALNLAFLQNALAQKEKEIAELGEMLGLN